MPAQSNDTESGLPTTSSEWKWYGLGIIKALPKLGEKGGTAQRVLSGWIHHIGDTGKARPSDVTIARNVGMGRRAVVTWMNRLCDMNVLDLYHTGRGPNNPNRYQLVYRPEWDTRRKCAPGAHLSEGGKCAPGAENVHRVHENVHRVHTKRIEDIEENTRELVSDFPASGKSADAPATDRQWQYLDSLLDMRGLHIPPDQRGRMTRARADQLIRESKAELECQGMAMPEPFTEDCYSEDGSLAI
ncbi:MAG: hypothetical protein F4238_01735 [Gemmatimonadetes bacterium]|nr:hypothetical protein [Gemmatimonadota bacterium]